MSPQRPAGAATARVAGGDWFSGRRFAALLVVLIGVCFPAVVAGYEGFCYLDSGFFAYPAAFFTRESFWRGELPLWNPLNQCGVPFLAQWNTMTLYPPVLFYLLLPLPWSYGVFCLGHLALAGVGMHRLAHRWTGNSLAAAVAGASFAFNGLTWYGLMWPHLIAALAWMPWVVIAVENATRNGGRAIVVAGLTAALQLFTGGVEAIMVTWLVVVVNSFVEKTASPVPVVQRGGRILGAIGLAAGLAAVQLLTFFELLPHSQRSSGYGSSSMAAMPPAGLANFLVPLFHSRNSLQGVPLLNNQVTWTSSYYLGAAIIALTLYAMWRVRTRRVSWLTGLAVFSLVMAMGEQGFVYDWLKRVVPVLGFMRFPQKFLLLTIFVVPLLAAHGLAALQAATGRDGAREWKKACWLAGTLAGLMVVIVIFVQWHPLPGDDAGATTANAVVRAIFLGAIFGVIALLRRNNGLMFQRVFQTGLVLLCWVDVYTHAPNLSPTVETSVLAPDNIRSFFKWDRELLPGISRAVESRDSLAKMFAAGSTNAELDIVGRRLSLFLDFNLLDHAAKVDGFYSLDLKKSTIVAKQTYLGTNDMPGLKDFLGVSHVTDPTNMVAWVTRNTFLPIVTAGQAPVFARDDGSLHAVIDDSFNPRQTVYLPEDARPEIHATLEPVAQVTNLSFANERIRFEVNSVAPAMVVVAQAFYPAWHAYVDGKPTTLFRANHGFQALEVPGGKHEVTLAYEDAALRNGALLTLSSLLAGGAAWFWRRRPAAGRSR